MSEVKADAKKSLIRRRGAPLSILVAMTAAVLLVLTVVSPAAGLGISSFNALDGALDAGATGLIVKNDTPSGAGDSSFGEGVHEDDAVPAIGTGSVPDKADLQNFHLALEKAGGDDFLYLSWERKPDQGGATDMDFELNQSDELSSNGVTYERTAGDLLITWAISNGGSEVEIAYRLWDGGIWGPENVLSGFAEGSYNTDANGDHWFGEAAINLTASGLFPPNSCVSFGSVYLKSRSSHSFQSKMKDFIGPAPVTVSNCGTIVVTKDTVPDDGTDFTFSTTGQGLSAFSLDDDSNGTLPRSLTFPNLLPGTYSVTEEPAEGYNLTSLTCTATGDGAAGTRYGTTSRAAISLSAGSLVHCTFVNTGQPGTLNVVKHVVNDNGGTAAAGSFTINVDGDSASPASFPGQESGTQVSLGAGSYEVTEGDHAGYSVSYSADCAGTIGRGETKTCTVTNNDQAPGLTVTKRVVNDDGGTATAAEFTINVAGDSPSPAAFPASGAGTEVALNSGSYSVSEAAHPGYEVSYSAGCSGSISVGESKSCTVTNDDIRPVLTVVKNVVNDNGGTAVAGDFEMSVTAAGDDPEPFDGSAAGTQVPIRAGAYSVIEGDHEGYSVSYSDGCEGTISVGETRTCTVSNDDIAPKLLVKKTVVNDDGGSAAAGAFTLDVTGEAASPASVPGSEAGTEVTLNAGSYSVTEAPSAGYAAVYSRGCEGSIAIGQTKTCTVTNDDLPPGLTVVKHVVNDNGGTATADDFTINVSGTGADPASFDGSEQGTEVALSAGAYSVTETPEAGYSAAYSEGCSGTIGLGESRLCTVTNDDVAPVLTVVKQVVNDDGGTLAPADFTLQVDNAAEPAGFAGSAAGTQVVLDAGPYSVTETESAGYAGTFSEGCSGDLDPGETATCTVTNNDLAPGLTVIKRVVNDNGGTAEASDFRISVASGGDTRTFAGSETGREVDLDSGAYEVTEEASGGYRGTLSGGCSGTLLPGEAAVCTITNDDIPAEVGGVVVDNPAGGAGREQQVEVLGVTLPKTGFNIAIGLVAAVVLLGMGFGLLLLNRRLNPGDPQA